jgi:hypothetical protein
MPACGGAIRGGLPAPLLVGRRSLRLDGASTGGRVMCWIDDKLFSAHEHTL